MCAQTCACPPPTPPWLHGRTRGHSHPHARTRTHLHPPALCTRSGTSVATATVFTNPIGECLPWVSLSHTLGITQQQQGLHARASGHVQLKLQLPLCVEHRCAQDAAPAAAAQRARRAAGHPWHERARAADGGRGVARKGHGALAGEGHAVSERRKCLPREPASLALCLRAARGSGAPQAHQATPAI